MLKKLQTKGKKKLILAILILAFAVIVGYLGFTAKNFFQSKAETHLVEAIAQNGYRITYDDFITDNVFAPSQISASNIVLRKIDSSLIVKSPKLVIKFDNSLSETTITKPEISLTVSGIGKNNNMLWIIKGQDDITITHMDDIFNISLPKKSILSSPEEPSEIHLGFKKDPLLIYTYAKHEETGEITNRSFDLKSNVITLSAESLSNAISFDSNKLYFNYNNLGFNKIVNIEVEQVIKAYDDNDKIIDNFTTNINLDITYKGTLTTGVNNTLKIKKLNVVNDSYSAVVTANLNNSNLDIVPTGSVNIYLSNINFFISKIHESMVSDTVAPQYIKNAKFHTIYNMKVDDFTKKSAKFANYINSNQETDSEEFSLAIKREKDSTIFFNQNNLQSIFVQFDQIFFSDN